MKVTPNFLREVIGHNPTAILEAAGVFPCTLDDLRHTSGADMRDLVQVLEANDVEENSMYVKLTVRIAEGYSETRVYSIQSDKWIGNYADGKIERTYDRRGNRSVTTVPWKGELITEYDDLNRRIYYKNFIESCHFEYEGDSRIPFKMVYPTGTIENVLEDGILTMDIDLSDDEVRTYDITKDEQGRLLTWGLGGVIFINLTNFWSTK